jgi:hypothetical protein
MSSYEPEVVEAAKGVVSGINTTRHTARAEAIAGDVLLGYSHSEICRRNKCSWYTVDAVMSWAEKQGRIEGIKDRLQQRVGAAAMMAWDRVNSDLASGQSPDQSASITAGIATDKMVALAGWQPTAQVNLSVGVQVRVDLAAELDQLRAATASQSVVHPSQVLDVETVTSLPAGVDTAADTVRSAEPCPEPVNFAPPHETAPAAPGGGGVPGAPGAMDDEASIRGR